MGGGFAVSTAARPYTSGADIARISGGSVGCVASVDGSAPAVVSGTPHSMSALGGGAVGGSAPIDGAANHSISAMLFHLSRWLTIDVDNGPGFQLTTRRRRLCCRRIGKVGPDGC